MTKTKIDHKMAKMGFSTTKWPDMHVVIGQYSDSVMNANLYEDKYAEGK